MDKNIMADIYKAIMDALESKFHYIGSVLDGEARKEIIAQNIRDKNDFLDNSSYIVERESDGIALYLGSNVPHEPYVLGGKVPSWTPIAPLIAWVERKGLSWVDKKDRPLSIKQMAYMIRAKIKREGIPARNVYQTVIDNREQWIYDQFESIEVRL